MHIKFLGHGRGSAQGAVAYLLRDTDHLGTERERVEVLRGNPALVAQVADGLDFVHRYTSGVVAWAPEDAPTEEEIEGVLDDLERVFTAGLDDPSRVAWTAVLHQEQGGGVHVHLLVARVDLETGKSLNVAPPGWEKTYDPLRDAWNWEKGWARPDDALRERLESPGRRALIEASALRAGIGIEPDPRALITRYLVQRIEAGAIEDRQGIIEALQEAGLEVPRQGKDYLTVLDPESGERYRMKGGLYGAGFTPETCKELGRAAGEEAGERPERGGIADPEQARQSRGELDQAIQRVAQYRVKRYRKPDPEPEKVHEVDLGHDGPGLDPSGGDRGGGVVLLREDEDGEAAPGRERAPEHRGPDQEATASLSSETVQGEVVLGSSTDQEPSPDLYPQQRRKRRRRATDPLKEEERDRDRAAFIARLEGLERACGGLGWAIGEYDEELQRLVQADGGYREQVERFREGEERLARSLGEQRSLTESLTAAAQRAIELTRQMIRQMRRGLGDDWGPG